MTKTSRLEEYARSIVVAQPEPPRIVSLKASVVASYSTGVAVVFAIVALLAVPGITIGLLTAGPWWQRAILVLVSAGAFVLFSGAPLLRGLRYRIALVRGAVVAGEIVEADWVAPGVRPPTLEASVHGMARGIRRVHHPNGTFEESFMSDAVWSSELRPGTRVRLLVDPAHQRVFFDLGPEETPSATLSVP